MSRCLTILIGMTILACSPATGAPPDDLSLDIFIDRSATALPFGSMVAVRNAGDGSNRLFVVEQAGRIWIWDGSEILATPFLDIRTDVDNAGNEQGLLGLAFHPEYSNNGFFYLNYTYDPVAGLDRTRIERFTISADANVADLASRQVVLEFEQDFSNHNGGDIHFSPSDGYLYIGVGDGGSGGDPNDRAQDLSQILGKMLRIDVDAIAPAEPNDLCGLVTNYGIPANNPFAGGSGDCDETWALGMRNPYRFSFDRSTADLLIGDVGQDAAEEVDFQPAASAGGENYGWDCREGSSTYFGDPSPSCAANPTMVDPVLEYAHGGTPFVCSVIGGYRYRGAIPGLVGYYVYADYCSNQIWLATGTGTDPAAWTTSVWSTTAASGISSFGEDESGELYVVEQNGDILRFTSATEGTQIFVDDFETGNTTAWASAAP